MLTDNTALQIEPPVLPEHYAAIRNLFSEYYTFLFSLPNMNLHIDLQKPDVELAELETGKYAPPTGALLLATYKNEYIGAVALRQLEKDTCEMKRLYVNPKGRGASVGYHLALAIIAKGRQMGYKKMRLDTHYTLKKAQTLYYGMGFYDIPNYNGNPVPGAVFMELMLQ